MYKTYAIMFQNIDTKKVATDSFYSRSEIEAKSDFRACYRHGNYQILAVVELPE